MLWFSLPRIAARGPAFLFFTTVALATATPGASEFAEADRLVLTFPLFPFSSTRAVDIMLTLSPSEMATWCRDCSRSVEGTIWIGGVRH